jgi:hypothetical protein
MKRQKLSLNKMSVANLNSTNSTEVRGGGYTASCYRECDPFITIGDSIAPICLSGICYSGVGMATCENC